MIEIRNLSKHFGPFRAVDDVSFNVARGEVLGFLGPNGAGKSTTMKMVTGFLAPTHGTILVDGADVVEQPVEVKSKIGYLPEGAPLYPDMTPSSLLAFVAEARGIEKSARARAVDDAIERVQIGDVRRQRIETLSKGYKRRVGLAQAILHDPDVLILDEPTDGLDPNQKHQVRTLIRDMAEGKVIVLSTHILEEVEAVCSRAIIISAGKLCFDGSPLDLRSRSRFHNAVSVTLRGAGTEARGALAGLTGVSTVEEQTSDDGLVQYTIFPNGNGAILGDVTRTVHERGWEVEHLFVEAGRLDDVFREITSNARA